MSKRKKTAAKPATEQSISISRHAQTQGYWNSDEAYETFVGGINRAGVHVNTTTVYGIPAYKRAVEVLSSRLAKTDCPVLRLGADNSAEVDRKHRAFKLLNQRFNPSTPAFCGKRAAIQDALHAGNGYVYNDVKNDCLVNLDPMRTSIIVQYDTNSELPELPLIVYSSYVGGKLYFFDASQIIHIRGLTYADSMGLQGMRLLEIMRDSLGGAMAQIQSSASFFRNNGSLFTYFLVPPGTQDGEIEKLEAKLKSKLTGVNNAGQMAVLKGNVSVNRLNMTSDEMQWVESRGLSLIDIANSTGINPRWIGSNVNLGYGAYEMDVTNDLDQIFDPWLQQMEQEFCDKLLTEEEKNSGEVIISFDRNTLSRGDQDTYEKRMVARYQTGLSSWQETRIALKQSSKKDATQQWLIPAGYLIEGEDDLENTIDDPANEAQTPQEQQDEAQTEQSDNQPEPKEDAVRSLLGANIPRLIERIQRDKDYFSEKHKPVFVESLPGCENSINSFFEILDSEMANVLKEQKPQVLNRISGDQLTLDCIAELRG